LLDQRAELKEQAESASAQLAETTRQLEAERRAAKERHDAALASLARYERLSASVREWWMPLLALVLFVAGAFGLATSVFRNAMPGTLPYLATAACMLALFGLLATMPLGPHEKATALSDQGWDGRMAKGKDLAPLIDRMPELPPLDLPVKQDQGNVGQGAGEIVAPPRPQPPMEAPIAKVGAEGETKPAGGRAVEYVFARDEKLKSDTNKKAEIKDSFTRDAQQDPTHVSPVDSEANAHLKGFQKPRTQLTAAPPPPPFVAREYGYRALRGHAEYSATLYWQPALVLENGEAVFLFDMGNAPRYRILAAGHTPDGRLDSLSVPLEGKAAIAK
jgi:hypothetical protein